MSTILALISGGWSKLAGWVAAAAGIAVAVLAFTFKIKRGARNEMRAEIQQRTLERIEQAQRIDAADADLDRDSVIDRLREQGHLRE